MSAKATAAIRLGVEGKSEVKAGLREIGNEGDAVANRWARSFDRASTDVEAGLRRQALAARKLGDMQVATPMQRQVQAAASTSYTGQSARESAQFFMEQARATAELETRTRAFLTVLDPAFAAQQRFNSEMAEARALVSAGTITLDQYCDKLRMERAALDEATAAKRRNVVSTGQMRAGTQQISYSIGDFFTQVSMGQGVLFAFTAQMNQTIQAIGLMQKESKGFIGFMAGPWGAVIQGAILVGGMLAAKWLDGADAAKEKEKAAKDLAASIDALEQSTRRAIETEYESQRATLASAASLRQKALDARSAAVEQLRLGQAELQRQRAVEGSMLSTNGMSANPARAAAASHVERLNAQLDVAIADLQRKEVIFRNAQAGYVGAAIGASLDKAKGLTREYEKILARLNREFRETGDLERYTRSRAALEQQYAREQEALQATEKKTRGKTEAQRAAAKAAREAAREARQFASDLQNLIDKYDPVTAAARRYRQELELIGKASRAEQITAAQEAMLRAAAEREHREAMPGWQIGEAVSKAMKDEAADRARRLDDRKRDLADSIAFAERELALVAANDNVRERELSTLRLIQDLKRDRPHLTKEETAALVAQHERLMDIADATEEARRNWEEWKGFASGVLDDIFNPDNWENWGDLGKKILQDLAREFIMLAALNPIKNALFGSSLPVLGGIFGAIGFATGTEHAPGGWAILGENGPELGYLPRGSKVYGASASRQALAGAMGGMQLTIDASIHAPGADAAALARVEAQQRRMMDELPGTILNTVAEAQNRTRAPLGLAA